MPDEPSAVCSKKPAHISPYLIAKEATYCRYYDVELGKGQEAKQGARVAVHYDAKWKGVTFMTSRQVSDGAQWRGLDITVAFLNSLEVIHLHTLYWMAQMI